MIYNVETRDTICFENVKKAEIKHYAWGSEYMPHAFAQLIKVNKKGIAVKLTAFESNPKATYTNYNDPVYKDSCLEFFVSFNLSSPLYMNFEMNSNGAFLSAVRTDRKNKTPIDQLTDITKIIVSTEKDNTKWSVCAFFPFEVIENLFGKCDFASGYTFSGNFYKCGDETDIPHFGSWSPIKNDKPDFHRPEFFARFVVI